MASTDTRSGFRLPWSSDRSRDDDQPESPDATVEPEGTPDTQGTRSDDGAWPVVDADVQPNTTDSDAAPTDPDASTSRIPEEPQAMVDTVSVAEPQISAPPKKPSKLIADLAAAMRTTAESAREQAVSQLEADARQVVEQIRSGSIEGAAALRQRADDDIASVRDWSKAEIARIREETDHKITDRKTALESEVAGHAAAIDRRVGAVESTVAEYQAEMAAFFERLLKEQDPARLASIAETMPEPPGLEAWADLDDLDVEAYEPADPTPGTEAIAKVADAPAPAADATAEATADADATAEAVADGAEAVDTDAVGTPTEAETGSPSPAFDPWGADESWVQPGGTVAVVETPTEAGANEVDPSGRATDTTPDADDTDRAAMIAALEAAAEAMVAGETVVEPDADHLASMAEAEAEAGLMGAEDTFAAIAPDLEVGGAETDATEPETDELDQSLVDRLASLIPGGGEEIDESTLHHTQVAVTGLVSVASIASFKRHLSRTPGVQRVTVSSGPNGEFVFAITHRDDVSLRDTIPTMPGFAARVTDMDNGVINVTARDPESEG